MRVLACLGLTCLLLSGCIDDGASAPIPTTTPDELRQQHPAPASELPDSVSDRACASFDDSQDDLWCYEDDLGFICCTYMCVGCFRPLPV